jgi:hypothetical protein
MTKSGLELIVVLLAALGACAALAALRVRPRRAARPPSQTRPPMELAVGVGTVRGLSQAGAPAADIVERQVTIDVETIPGQLFTGRLRCSADDPVVAALRPGSVVLVAFDPVAREHLSLPDDIVAVRAAFDRMLMRKGLTTAAHLDLIRHGIRSRGVVTAMRPTGLAREDHREVELDLMVSRPEGGQFPAHETALIPESAVENVGPGAIIDTYYRPENESAIAVCVPG